MLYHARDYLTLQGTVLTDPNRHSYIRRLTWASEGFPDVGQNKSDAEKFHQLNFKMHKA